MGFLELSLGHPRENDVQHFARYGNTTEGCGFAASVVLRSARTLALMGNYEEYDITKASFEEFVTFIFDRVYIPIPPDGKEPSPWYWHAQVKYDPVRVTGFYIRLFTDPALIEKYSEFIPFPIE